MSDGYEVLMADLLAMARAFDKESRAAFHAVPSTGVHAVNGGSSAVNGALAEALRAAGLTTSQFAAVVAGHGQKLNGAYHDYQNAEESNAQLIQQLTDLITGK